MIVMTTIASSQATDIFVSQIIMTVSSALFTRNTFRNR